LPSKGKVPAAPKIPAGVLPNDEDGEEPERMQAVVDEHRKGKGKQADYIDLTKDEKDFYASQSNASRTRHTKHLPTSSDDSSSYESRKRRKRKRRKRRRSPSTSSSDNDSDDRDRSHRRKRRYDSDESNHHRSKDKKNGKRSKDDSEEDTIRSPQDIQVSPRSTISPLTSHASHIITALRSPPRISPLPTLANDPEKVESTIADWISQKVLLHPSYLPHFLKVKGLPPPVPLYKSVLLLSFVKGILDEYTGCHTPPDLRNAPSQMIKQVERIQFY
jgi:hypothetical protein